MKKLLVLISCLLPGFFVAAQHFVVKGKLTKVKEPIDVTLTYRGTTQNLLSKDGTFEFKGNSFPTDATIRTMPHHPTLTMADTAYWPWLMKRQNLAAVRNIFLEGNVTINGTKSLTDAIVGGSKKQNLYEEYRAEIAVFNRKLDSLRKPNAEDVEPEPSATEKQLLKERDDVKMRFVERYPDSYFSLNLATLESRGDPARFELMLNTLDKRFHETSLYKSLNLMVMGSKSNNVGNAARDFTQNTAEGTPISLASYKGKYVLLDFWASWCVPCRAENPNLVAAYNKFNSKNFEILSISIDEKKDLWVKAVKEDKLPWTQVLDSKGSNATAYVFAITAVPQNFLIDPNGIIIAKDLRGEELQQTLEKMLK